MDEEGLTTTANKLIHIGKPIAFDEDKFLEDLLPLMEAAYDNDENIREIVKGMVNTYHPAGEAQYGKPASYRRDEAWVNNHIEQFGKEPSFF